MQITSHSNPHYGISLLAAVGLFALLVIPSPAAAQSLQQQIKVLQQKVNTLQQSLLQRTAESPVQDSSTANFNIPNAGLSIGDSGPAVKQLQTALNNMLDEPVATSGPGSPGQETDFFGPRTRAAVERFQAQHADEVLTPIGLTEPTGFFGQQTRWKLSELLTTASDMTRSSTISRPIRESVEDLSSETQTEVEKLE